MIRLVFSNTHCKTKKRDLSEITKANLYKKKLFLPNLESSCFSVFRYNETSFQELKDYALEKNSEEHRRVFIGFAVLQVKTLNSFGLSISRVNEDGMNCHFNICFDDFIFTRGIPNPGSIEIILDQLQSLSKFYHDTNRKNASWNGENL